MLIVPFSTMDSLQKEALKVRVVLGNEGKTLEELLENTLHLYHIHKSQQNYFKN